MKGKRTCKVLKDIRQFIARQNDIPLATKECTFEGECKGTCPACEAEMRYLETELDKRKKAGKNIVLAGVATCLMLSAAACGETPPAHKDTAPTAAQTTEASSCPTDNLVDFGEIPELLGDIVLDGDIPLEGEPTWDDRLDEDPYYVDGVIYNSDGEDTP